MVGVTVVLPGTAFRFDYVAMKRQSQAAMKTLHEIEEAIETLPLPDRLRLYRDMPQLIRRNAEDLDWQRLAIENFFQDDSPEDEIYDRV